MSLIQRNLKAIDQTIKETALSCGRDPEKIALIAVSKRKSIELIHQAIAAGATHFGENYIQEAIEKIDVIGKNAACWHFIGHLQTNKAKFAVPYFEYIHTVDSFKLAREINKQAQKIEKIQKILIQVNISEETTKSGTGKGNVLQLFQSIQDLKNIQVKGLMCMPPYFQNPDHARKYFRQLADLKEQIIDTQLPGTCLDHLSMGMSNDFMVAIQEGATMVRVGTSIFGDRD